MLVTYATVLVIATQLVVARLGYGAATPLDLFELNLEPQAPNPTPKVKSPRPKSKAQALNPEPQPRTQAPHTAMLVPSSTNSTSVYAKSVLNVCSLALSHTRTHAHSIPKTAH